MTSDGAQAVSTAVDVMRAAAKTVDVTFADVPSTPVPVSGFTLSADEVAEVVRRYRRHGFAVLAGPPAEANVLAVETLTASLGLGAPFIPPLYTMEGGVSPPVSRISAAFNSGTTEAAHPSFSRTVGQELHCDGTLQDIGYVKASVLLCQSPAEEGGDTMLFNSSAVFAALVDRDPDAAAALAQPGVLVRRATINGSNERHLGPAFAVHDGRLLGGYSVTETDTWAVPEGTAEDDVCRGVQFLREAARPGDPSFLQFSLAAGEAIVVDNTRISHGRTAYRDSADRQRCLYRSLHLHHPRVAAGNTAKARTAPPPHLDAELAAPLAAILAVVPTPLTADLVADRRARTVAGSLSDEAIRRGGAFTVEEHRVPGPADGPDVPILLCLPTAASGPFPVIYNMHGGGMVAGNNRTPELADELDRAEELQLAVAAVQYRLAPEFPDPVPGDDCYAGLLGLVKRGAAWGIDPDRVVVSGNSAGGALAAAVAQRARDTGGPPLLGQMLQCAMLDDRCATASMAQLERAGIWDGASNRAGWTALLGARRGGADVLGHTAPARATDLAGLPPAYLDVGAVEALRDEVIEYAARIWRAGGRAELHVWSGAFHSFDHWVPDAVVSVAARRARVSWLRRLLDGAP